MDCEAFDKVVLDRIFSELDDVSVGAVQRHVAHCSRCRQIESSLRATRDVGQLAVHEVPPGFLDSVVALERQAHAILPFRQRLGRLVSVAASYAMRPQHAMAVLALLMIVGSLFLVRVRPDSRLLVQVTERGVPEGEPETAAPAARAASSGPDRDRYAGPEPKATAGEAVAATELLAEARRAYRDGRFAEARDLAERVTAGGGAEASAAALLSAEATRFESGCEAALPRLATIRTRSAKSAAEEATWHSAECQLELGNHSEARQLFDSLSQSAAWGSRARERLRSVEPPAAATSESNPAPPPAAAGGAPASP